VTVEFRIADTFTSSLARLTGAEQKAVKTTAFHLQLNLSSHGLRLHRLDLPRDPNFGSVRANDADIRLIVHRTPTALLLCFVACKKHRPSRSGVARLRELAVGAGVAGEDFARRCLGNGQGGKMISRRLRP
jgi:hypothetical protein